MRTIGTISTPMKRRLAAVLLLLFAQVFAVLAPGTTVYCVHDDGRLAIELCGSECCRAAREVDEARLPRGADESGPRIDAVGERCRDVPVQPQETPLARSAPRVDPAPAADLAFFAAVVWSPAALHRAPASARPTSRGPTPDVVPRSARPSLLRC
jgi:hypothetical protein